MVCLHLALFLTYVLTLRGAHVVEASLVRQQSGFLSVNVAGQLSLSCFSRAKGVTWIFWYKQTPGHKPVIISGIYLHDEAIYFYNEFKNDSRFSLGTENGNYCLNISDLRTSDSGTYYCAASKFYDFEFAEGTVVNVQGLSTSVQASVRRPASKRSQPLECRVDTENSDGEHWFQDSEGSHAGIMYTTKQTHTCGYNLLMRSQNTSSTGIYCAVASCGHILLGNRIEVDFGSEEHHLGLVFLLSGTLAFTAILTFLLVISLYKRTSCNSTGSPGRSSSAANEEGCGDAINLHYEPLNVEVPNRSRAKETETALYSLVQLHT